MGWYQSYQLQLRSYIKSLNGDKVMKYLHLSATLTWNHTSYWGFVSLKEYNIINRLNIDDLWIIYYQWIITSKD